VAQLVLPSIAALLLLAGSVAAALDVPVSLRLIDEAVGIGQSRVDAVRARFHRPYRIAVGRPPVDYLEVVTPFRRMVILAEERALAGGRGFTQREAAATLGESALVVDIVVEMTFHPLNVFVGVPGYDVALVAPSSAAPLAPRAVTRTPRFGPRIEVPSPATPNPAILNTPGVSQPVTGGAIVARFDAAVLDRAGVYDVVISEMGKELGRGRVNFGSLR
jgi:hypothetical protein